MVTNFLMSVHLWKVRNGLQFLPFCWVLRTWTFNKTCVLLSGYQHLKWDLSFFGGFRSKQIRHPCGTIFPVPSRPAVSSFLPPPQRARRRIGPRFGAANPLLMIYILNAISGRPKQRQRSPLSFCIPVITGKVFPVCSMIMGGSLGGATLVFFSWFCSEEQGWKPLGGAAHRRVSRPPRASSSSSSSDAAPSAGLSLFPQRKLGEGSYHPFSMGQGEKCRV